MLSDAYFEEQSQDAPYRGGHSYYWLYLEWYRLQMEHPDIKPIHSIGLPTKQFLDLFRESARKGNVFGLDNPWD